MPTSANCPKNPATFTRMWALGVPVALPTTVPPLSTSARTPCAVPPDTLATTSSCPATMSGVVSSRVTCAAIVGSSQTVCQMPDAAV